MAKRFTDSNKYKKPFIRGLQGPYKLLWDYLYHDCDHSGIWIVDFEIAQSYVGKDMPINKKKALELFNFDEPRVVEIEGGKKWFLPGFIEFQYGVLSEKNRAHSSVIVTLKKLNLINPDLTLKEFKPLASPLQGGKEKDKDKEKEKDMEQEKEEGGDFKILDQFPFDEFWEMYDKKIGRADCEKKYSKLTETEKEQIFNHVPSYVASKPDKQFRMHPETYLNGKHWNDEIVMSAGLIQPKSKMSKLRDASLEADRIFDERNKQATA
jgi:hypothetical protein